MSQGELVKARPEDIDNLPKGTLFIDIRLPFDSDIWYGIPKSAAKHAASEGYLYYRKGDDSGKKDK